MKNQKFRGVTAALIIFLLTGFSSCVTEQEEPETLTGEPTAKITGMEIEDISFEKIDLLFTLSLENPYPVALTLAGYDYDLLIEDNSFLSGESDDELRIASRDSSQITLPISFTFAELRETMDTTEERKEAPYSLHIGFDIDVPVVSKDIRVDKTSEGTLPIPSLPDVFVKELIITNFGRTIISIDYGIEVFNPNTFTVELGKMDYSFSVNNIEWASGNTDRSYTMEPEESQTFHMPLELNYLEVGKTVVNLLMSGQELDYTLEGSSSVGINFENIEIPEHPFNFQKSGIAAIIRP